MPVSTPSSATSTSLPYREEITDVIAKLASHPSRGLTANQAQQRLQQYGKNELSAEQPRPAWRRLLAQFKDALVVLLMVAASISAVLWLYERETPLPYEAVAIFSIVLLNALLGFIQESRAASSVNALKQMTAAHARVVRDGQPHEIAASEVVPGDIILLEEGDTVPADARVIQSSSLECAEAPLTGESLPVAKHTAPIPDELGLGDRHNMVFSGAAVAYGRGRGVVVSTGMATEMGRIAGMLRETPEAITPLQEELNRVGKLLGVMVLFIAMAMIGTIMLIQDVRGWPAILDVLILGIALAVAAVPEGLPAVVTAVLSLGVQRMARRNAIMLNLAAVETLGSATVIASDKTGTLTRNEMTVRTVVSASGVVRFHGAGYTPVGWVESQQGAAVDGRLRVELERILTIAERANNAILQQDQDRWTVLGDATEAALLVAARKAGLDAGRMSRRFERVAEIPFSSERKLMSTLHTAADSPGRVLVFTKGAPDVLLERCTDELVGDSATPLTDARRREIMAANEELARGALRTLAVACRSVRLGSFDVERLDDRIERDLTFAGLIGMIDPPRAEARDAVAKAKRAGIRPIMITGDHPATARVIARELGISSEERVLTGAELQQATDDALMQLSQECSVFARVDPEHKLRIVRALQRRGAVVAMTGDGVNDAPALKSADIGVAMGITGTDVSKGAADMVLADDNFASIVAAVEEGRSIFANIRKFLRFLLSSNMGEVLTMFFGVLLADVIGLRAENGATVLPLLATQLLWINLATDGAPALALGVDPPNHRVMSDPPRAAGEAVITPRMWFGTVFVAVIMAIGVLAILDASLPGGLISGSGSAPYAQTMAFTTMMLFQLFNVLNARSDEQSALDGLFSNGWLWGAIGLALTLQAAVIYVPVLQQAFSTVSLHVIDWLCCLAVASSVLWLRELSKVVTRRRKGAD